MGMLFNPLGQSVPIRERREITANMAALNAETTLDLNGDESALVYINGDAATFTGTISFWGTIDSSNYFPILAMPYMSAGAAGAPSNAQGLLVEAINTTNVRRVYALKVGQLKKIRVLLTAFTTGSLDCTIVSDANDNIHPSMFDGRPTSLMVSVTAAVGVAAVATLPLVAGLRHYVDFINVTKFATTTLTAGTVPVLVTTANLPGALIIPFPADAALQGTDVNRELDFGGTGLAAIAVGTATTVTAPATPNIIWRINVGYRVGL